MKHITRNAANFLIPTIYGLQYNCGKFNLEYMSNSISFKFQEVGCFFEYCRAKYFTFYSGFSTRITVAKETCELSRCRYILKAKDMTRTYRNQSSQSSQTDSEGCLGVSASSLGAVCGMIPSYHGNTSADVTNNQTQRIQINVYSLHYGIMQLLSRNISKLDGQYIYIYIYILFLCYP